MATQAQRHHLPVDAGPGLRGRHALRAVLLRAAARDGGAVGRVRPALLPAARSTPRTSTSRRASICKTRQLAAFLFLLQRGLSAGHHDLRAGDHPVDGARLVAEPDHRRDRRRSSSSTRSSGGTRAVSQTQKQQMVVMLGGMVVAFVVDRPPAAAPTCRSATPSTLAGALGKMNVVDFVARPRQPLHLLVGPHRRLLPGAVVLRHRPVAGAALPVGALGDREPPRACCSTACSRSRCSSLILFVGVMVFVFYQFNAAAAVLQRAGAARACAATAARRRAARARGRAPRRRSRASAPRSQRLQRRAGRAATRRRSRRPQARVRAAAADARRVRERGARADRRAAARAPRRKDADYVFLSFVMANLPRGLVGLLLAVILCAAMSSTASELTALGGCTRGRLLPAQLPPRRRPTRTTSASPSSFTVGWGVLAVVFAAFAVAARQPDPGGQHPRLALLRHDPGHLPGRLLRRRGCARTPVFVAALLVARRWSSALWLATDIGFLWFNVIGCAAVLLLSAALTASGLGAPPTPRKEHRS